MSLARLLLRSSGVAAAPPAAISAPVFLQLGAGAGDDLIVLVATQSTYTSASVSPPANARVLVAYYGRGNLRTHDSVTGGFATVAGFAKLTEAAVEDPGGNHHLLSLWEATATATPGSGTIVATASGTHFGHAMGAVVIENVGSRVASAQAANAAGTSVGITLTGATTGDQAALFGISRGDATASGWTFGAGQVAAGNSPIAQGTNHTFGAAHKPDPAETQTLSGLVNNQAHLLVGAVYRGAA